MDSTDIGFDVSSNAAYQSPSFSLLFFFFGRNHCTNQLCEITEKADRDQNTLVRYTCHCDPGAESGEEKTETTGIAPESCIHVGPPPNERKLFFFFFFFFFFLSARKQNKTQLEK